MEIQNEAQSGVAGQVDELIEHLGRYVRRHREVREILRQRKQLAAHENRGALEEIGEVEREVLTDIGWLERDRIARTDRLARLLGSPSTDSMRLAELVGYVEPDQRDALLDLREEIRELADELDRLRASNRCGITVQTLEDRQLFLALVPGRNPAETPLDLDEVDEDRSPFPPPSSRRGL